MEAVAHSWKLKPEKENFSRFDFSCTNKHNCAYVLIKSNVGHGTLSGSALHRRKIRTIKCIYSFIRGHRIKRQL